MLCDFCGKSRNAYNHDWCSPAAEAQAEEDMADDPGPDMPEHL